MAYLENAGEIEGGGDLVADFLLLEMPQIYGGTADHYWVEVRSNFSTTLSLSILQRHHPMLLVCRFEDVKTYETMYNLLLFNCLFVRSTIYIIFN
jgi:hypothetical protein